MYNDMCKNFVFNLQAFLFGDKNIEFFLDKREFCWKISTNLKNGSLM